MSEERGGVLVKALRPFRGEPGEGDGSDGHVAPHHKPFRVSRQRLADLKANGLVEEHKEGAPEDARAKAAGEDKRDADGKYDRDRRDRRGA